MGGGGIRRCQNRRGGGIIVDCQIYEALNSRDQTRVPRMAKKAKIARYLYLRSVGNF